MSAYLYGGESDWDDTDLLLRDEAAARLDAELAAVRSSLESARAGAEPDATVIARLTDRIVQLEERRAHVDG